MKIARTIRVEGRVQGVGFRYWTVEVASALGLTGWVRNRPDGSVEVLAVGEAVLIDRFIEELHQGPPVARVARVDAQPSQVQEFAGFTQEATA